MGYSSVSKAYKVYHSQTVKMIVTRDVHFNEGQQWKWDNSQRTIELFDNINDNHPGQQRIELLQDELEDDPPVKGKRLLSDVYQRCNVAICEPVSCEEAQKDLKWKVAMEEEMSMIQKNKTWELVDRPEGRKVIGVKWVFRTKLNADCSINKHKAKLVVKGYAQIFGVDYYDTFAPVSRLDTIRLVLAVAAQNG